MPEITGLGLPIGEITGPGQHAMLLVAIDNLHPLEQFFGDAMVHDILRISYDRLARAVPRVGTLWQPQARRFAVTIPGMSESGALSLAAVLQAAVARDPFETSAGPVAVTASVGCAVADNASLESLGTAANDALIEAMASGIGAVRIARSPEDVQNHRARVMCIAQTTMEALGAGHLTLAYQPVVSAKGDKTIAFHECLARISLDTGDLMSAADFMPTAERLGLATIIDRQVLVMALDMLKEHPTARLAINLFPQSMQDSEWMTLFRNAIREDPALADRLIVEITETGAVEDPVRTRRFMNTLQETGVCFALDDFGVGNTSFGQLRQFRFDIVKIDRSFTQDIAGNPDDRFFAETLVSIAERFDMMSVAEGVQNERDARILAGLGVGYFQGYYFGRPSLMLDPAPEPESTLRLAAG
ncbi:MAG: GGDEF domain-containing phosphodiesterase [Pseudomonadota bacterium]